MTTTVDELPAGEWFVLEVMKAGNSRKWDWVALMLDVPFDEIKYCQCKVAFLFVHPDEYRPQKGRTARELFLRIPGKHRNRDAAYDALEKMTATRH